MTKATPVIAIDGPSGSGKGTIARRVAVALGWHLLDSGALYRLLALAATRRGIGLDDADALAELAANLDVSFAANDDGEELIWLDGKPTTAGQGGVAGPATRLSEAPGTGCRRARYGDSRVPRRRPQGLPYRQRGRTRAKAT
jgi:hypothetical protein